MAQQLPALFENNQRWAAQAVLAKPRFFSDLAAQQAPRYMWIGCSDSRVPANQITGLAPGEIFVHRNIANVVVHSDLNALSTIHFAVERLRVEHIMVVGHYGCSGVQAALEGARIGLADHWIRHIQDVRDRHGALLESLSADRRARALCELNVIEQVTNVCVSTIVSDSWARGQALTVHGWVYGVHNGLLRDLDMSVGASSAMPDAYRNAVTLVQQRYLAQPEPTARETPGGNAR